LYQQAVRLTESQQSEEHMSAAAGGDSGVCVRENMNENENSQGGMWGLRFVRQKESMGPCTSFLNLEETI
jgi:hypothetical protein